MGFWSRAADLAKKAGVGLAEKLNLKTDHNLKGEHAQDLKAEKLISKKRATLTSIASAATGLICNIGLSVACPPLAVAAALNAYQLGTAVTNYRRARREVKRRKVEVKGFREFAEQNDTPARKARDIAIGCVVKGALTAATAGIVGFDNIAHNFVDLANKAGSHAITTVATQNVGDLAANHASSALAGPPGGGHEQLVFDKALAHHPHVAQADNAGHQVLAGLGDASAQKLSAITGHEIDDKTSWAELRQYWEQADVPFKVFVQTALAGLGQELLQPLQNGFEFCLEKWRGSRQERRARTAMSAADGLNRYLDEKGVEKMVQQQMDITAELAKRHQLHASPAN